MRTTPAISETGRPRPGFTLIEILAVLGIIGILATLAVSGMQASISARRRARARGEIQAMSMACENYRKVYGDYPCASTGTSPTTAAGSATFRKDFFDQLMGRKVLKASAITGGTAVALLSYNNAANLQGKARMKGFLSVGIVPSNDDLNFTDPLKCFEFLDPWGNPYGYRYRILNASTALTTAAPYSNWKSSEFLLVSPGANFYEKSPLAEEEYWPPAPATTSTNGVVLSTYFLDDANGRRADNLVNWQTN